MLWCAVFLPHLALEWGPAAQGCVAVVDPLAQRRVVCAVNAAAHHAGIQIGMDATVALAHAPEVRFLDRALKEESRALNALAAWATQYSSDLCLDAARSLLWIEVGASRRYFDGLEILLALIREGLAQLGYTAQCATAPTLEAAALLARAGENIIVQRRTELLGVLGPRELHKLALDAKVRDHLHAAGLRTIRELLEIPPAALTRRFGRPITDYLARLLGRAPDVKRRFQLPSRYHRRLDCGYPIATVEGVLFPLQRLLRELQGELRGRDLALQELRVAFKHRDSEPTQLILRTTTAQRDAARLLALLRETLDRTVLPEPVTEIRLSVERFALPDVGQGDFFDDRFQKDAAWMAVLDKLRARLGEQAVRRLGLIDDHRPEKAWCVSESAPKQTATIEGPQRPLWILEPQPLERLPQLLGTPERIESGWWHSQDCSRDYYLARSPQGARWWLYRDIATGQWFLHGLWG